MCAKKITIRMCVVCRERYEQKSLLRFQLNSEKILEFSGYGRSFYICKKCICKDSEKLVKILNAKLRIKNKKMIDFGEYFSKVVQRHNKEISTNG